MTPNVEPQSSDMTNCDGEGCRNRTRVGQYVIMERSERATDSRLRGRVSQPTERRTKVVVDYAQRSLTPDVQFFVEQKSSAAVKGR